MTARTAIALLALLVPATGAAQTALPSVDLPPALDRVLRDYERAWAAGDAAALAALFTEDGFVAGRDGWKRGRAEIRAEYGRAGGDLRLRALAFHTAGDAGWMVGAYGYGDDATSVDRGRFVLALRRDADGRWLIAADLDRSIQATPGG